MGSVLGSVRGRNEIQAGALHGGEECHQIEGKSTFESCLLVSWCRTFFKLVITVAATGAFLLKKCHQVNCRGDAFSYYVCIELKYKLGIINFEYCAFCNKLYDFEDLVCNHFNVKLVSTSTHSVQICGSRYRHHHLIHFFPNVPQLQLKLARITFRAYN